MSLNKDGTYTAVKKTITVGDDRKFNKWKVLYRSNHYHYFILIKVDQVNQYLNIL